MCPLRVVIASAFSRHVESLLHTGPVLHPTGTPRIKLPMRINSFSSKVITTSRRFLGQNVLMSLYMGNSEKDLSAVILRLSSKVC